MPTGKGCVWSEHAPRIDGLWAELSLLVPPAAISTPPTKILPFAHAASSPASIKPLCSFIQSSVSTPLSLSTATVATRPLFSVNSQSTAVQSESAFSLTRGSRDVCVRDQRARSSEPGVPPAELQQSELPQRFDPCVICSSL
ncbi:unnamed protein product [Cuscuta europaea]|uniref:Uncharacterized protein n=1 Tax=Cuscuta europaea TaxID=41803 RepID=A0A9P0YQE7_CUSEU|nr:unnamed protein product [Cuscuta europaea]